MSVYYFVVYEHRRLDDGFQPTRTNNLILKDIHPVAWAANPPEIYKKNRISTYLHFWAEIPEEVALAAKKAFGIEGASGE